MQPLLGLATAASQPGIGRGSSRREAFVGMDNRAAGRTTTTLIEHCSGRAAGRWLGDGGTRLSFAAKSFTEQAAQRLGEVRTMRLCSTQLSSLLTCVNPYKWVSGGGVAC